jgi:hypothetical protein
VNVNLVTKVTVKLMMDMGGTPHGSSPVTLTPMNAAHFEISKAYFPMAGAWEIRVGFEYNGATHEIVIPMDVK